MADNQEESPADISAHPVQFIENAGQAHEDILYQVKSSEFSFDFTRDALLVSGPSEDCEDCGENVTTPVIVTVAGAEENVTVEAFDKLDGYANFLIGQNESDWQQYVPWYGGIRYVDILPGIDLSYSGKQGVLKREFTVREGADPSLIRLIYGGNEGLSLTEDGSLQVSTSFGNLTERAPYSYQIIDGNTIEVGSSYRIFENGEVGYTIGEYDPAYPLIIDPYLEYSTLLGGTLEDYGMDIARDSSGDVYVTGYTSSCNFPINQPLVTPYPFKFNGSYCHNSRDVFVTKIKTNQTTGNATIDFSTYLGGTSSDFGRGIAVDSLNNIYIAGDTFSEDFPYVFPFELGDRLHGSNDAFVIKLRSDGANIWWSDYLGGNFADRANDIALDSLNAVYLTGQTVGNSPYKKKEERFPTTPYAYQTAPNPDAVMGDAFAVKISPDGKKLEYSTYISGSGQDYGNGIAVDGKGMAYIVGTTSSTNLLLAEVPYYQKNIKGGQDAFLFKMNFQAGLQPVYATYLGGNTGYDYGEAVAVDSADSAYVTGATASNDFPVWPVGQAMQNEKGWPYDAFEKDAFVTKFSSDGETLLYSTYLGGSMDDWGYDIKVDDITRAYVTGYTRSPSFPRVNPIKYYSSGQDAFFTIIDDKGRSAVFSTTFGGYRDEVGRGVAIAPNGNTSFVTGYTSSPTINNLICGDDCEKDAFPVYKWINQSIYAGRTYNGGNFTGDFQGSFDAFVVKFGQPSLIPSMNASPICSSLDEWGNRTVTFNDTTVGSGNILNRLWNFGDRTPIFDSGSEPKYDLEHNYSTPGQYDATLTVYTYSDILVSDPLRITVCPDRMSDNYTIVGYSNATDPNGIIDVPKGREITFNGFATNFTATNYKWVFNDGTRNETGASPTVRHTFTKQGTFWVNLTATTGTCCDERITHSSKQIRVLAPPCAQFVNNTTATSLSPCAPRWYGFDDRSNVDATCGAPTAWQWNFGDNSDNATIQNVTHRYILPGKYTVTLTASNVAGSTTAQKKEYATVYGDVKAGFSASPLEGKAPLKVFFTDKSEGTVISHDWVFGDEQPPIHNYTPNPYHIYEKPGQYTVNLTVTSICGDPSSSSSEKIDYITVNGNLSPIILFGNSTFPPTSENPVNGTPVLNVTFLGNTTDGSLIDSAIWDFGDGNTTTQTRGTNWPSDNTWINISSHKYYAYNDYTPVLQVTNTTYGSDTSGNRYKNWIGVYPPIIVNFSATPPDGIVGQSILFTDQSSGSPVDWNWLFGDASRNVSGLSSVSHVFNSSATYNVSLTAWNKYGATGIGYRNVTITSADTSGRVLTVPQNVSLITEALNYRVLNVVLDRADYGLSSYTVKIDLNNSARAHIRDWATKPSWADRFSYSVSPAFDSITLAGYKESGKLPTGSRNVSLGNISLAGVTTGAANLTLNSSSIAMYGSSFMVLSGVTTDIHVYDVPPLPGYTNRPGDTWPPGIHDGLIDDFNGDGVVDTKDVTAFFNAWVSDGLDGMPIPPFDYNNNGRRDVDDVVEFFHRIW